MQRLLSFVAFLGTIVHRSSGADGEWVIQNPAGAPSGGGIWHSGAEGDGVFFVAGGSPPEETIGALWAFSSYNNDWRQVSWDLEAPYAAAMAVEGGILYAYGGRYVADGGFSQDLLRVPIYNERVSEWEHMNANLTRIPPAANGHTLTAWNGILFLVHGWDSYEYFRAVWALDLRQLYLTGTAGWVNVISEKAAPEHLPSARNGHSIVKYDGRMIMFGGFSHDIRELGVFTRCNGTTTGCFFYNDTWSWVPSTRVETGFFVPWQEMLTAGTPPSPRYGHAAAVVQDFKMFIYGGTSGSGIETDLYYLDLRTNIWVQMFAGGDIPPVMATPRGASINGFFYVYSGNGYNTLLYRYQPPLNDNSTGNSTCPPQEEPPTMTIVGLNLGIALSLIFGCMAGQVFGVDWKPKRK